MPVNKGKSVCETEGLSAHKIERQSVWERVCVRIRQSSRGRESACVSV